MDIEKPAVLDILETNAPALSTTSDMPVVETRPDSSPPVEATPAVPPDEGEAEQLEESATPTTETPGQPAAPRGVGKKIAELTKARAEAEARAKLAEESLANALKLREQVEPKSEEDPEPVRPTRDSFTDPDAYDQAILAYADDKAAHTARRQVKEMLAEQDSKVQQQEAQRQQTEIRESYNVRLEKARGKYADFEEVAQTPDVQVSMPMAHVIMTSDQGPDIQYFLGKNPEEAQRIAGFTLKTPQGLVPDVSRQLYEMGLLAARIAQPVSKPPISNAPPPVRTLKQTSAPVVKTPEEESMEEYAARRSKELREQARRH